jgi:hypothetical protein
MTIRLTGGPVEEGPGEPPVCPGCRAVAVYHEATISRLIVWRWETRHEPDCSWMSDPNAESY